MSHPWVGDGIKRERLIEKKRDGGRGVGKEGRKGRERERERERESLRWDCKDVERGRNN